MYYDDDFDYRFLIKTTISITKKKNTEINTYFHFWNMFSTHIYNMYKIKRMCVKHIHVINMLQLITQILSVTFTASGHCSEGTSDKRQRSGMKILPGMEI
jgi:hypothetical protein